jgi:hypothetical protein
MRSILFVAFDLKTRTEARSPERYVEQRQVLASFGRLVQERTSGVHRIQTPPDGIRRQERHDAEQTERLINSIIGKLPEADCLVIPSYSGLYDALQRIIRAALARGLPVLILKLAKPQAMIGTVDIFKDCEGVDYLVHDEVLSHPRGMNDFRTKINRYMQALPKRVQNSAG